MRFTKKSTALILSILMLLSAFSVMAGISVFAADKYKITLKSAQNLFNDIEYNYAAGDEFDLNLYLQMSDLLESSEMKIEFEPTALFAKSYKKGSNLPVNLVAGGVNNANFQNRNKFITANFTCGLDAADYSTEALLFTIHFIVKDEISENQNLTIDISTFDGIEDPYDLSTDIPYIDNNAVVEAQKDKFSIRAELGDNSIPPTTEAPTTEAPTTAPPTTVPPTTAPPMTAPPTTAPPTTAPPTTAPSTTAPPTTAPPTTAPPTTAPPTTAPPTTAPPTTVPPTTAPPTSAPPTTAPPTSAPPTTAPPTSLPPTTAPPTTAPPTSAPPTTVPPTTQAPTTTAPPTTEAPTTEAPTTKPEMYTFYYQPSIDQEAAGFTYKFSYNDLYGVNPQNWHEYTFTRTLIRLNGIYIYSVSVPKQYDRVRKILYQVYDGDTWVSQIEFSNVTLSYYNNMVVKSDGSIKPENTTRPPTEEEFTTAPPSTTATEQSTTEPVENTTAPVEETTAEATSPTEATEETTAQATEETTQDIQPTTDEPQVTSSPFTATKVFYYLPSTQQAVAGYSYKLTVQDNKGEFELYDFHASDIFVNGARVYTAEIPADIEITVLYFQVYDFEKWISQISVSPDIAEGNIIKSDGEVYKDEPETTIEPTSQEPETETQLITEEPTTIAPTETTTSAVINKKANPIKVSAKKKTIKANKLIKKAQKIKPLKVTKAKGKLAYKLIKKGSYKKLFKKAKINSKGVISIKKLKIKKGTYKLKVSVTAKGNIDYKAKKVTKIVKIRII